MFCSVARKRKRDSSLRSECVTKLRFGDFCAYMSIVFSVALREKSKKSQTLGMTQGHFFRCLLRRGVADNAAVSANVRTNTEMFEWKIVFTGGETSGRRLQGRLFRAIGLSRAGIGSRSCESFRRRTFLVAGGRPPAIFVLRQFAHLRALFAIFMLAVAVAERSLGACHKPRSLIRQRRCGDSKKQ